MCILPNLRDICFPLFLPWCIYASCNTRTGRPWRPWLTLVIHIILWEDCKALFLSNCALSRTSGLTLNEEARPFWKFHLTCICSSRVWLRHCQFAPSLIPFCWITLAPEDSCVKFVLHFFTVVFVMVLVRLNCVSLQNFSCVGHAWAAKRTSKLNMVVLKCPSSCYFLIKSAG